MKLLSVAIISCLLFTFSCSKKETTETSAKKPKSSVKAKFRENKPQEPPPRVVIDINEEGYSADAVLKIDEEIPVLELIVGKDWKQNDLDKLKKMQMLDTLRLENMDSSSFDLSFTKSIKSLKSISFKGGKTSLEALKSLSGSSLENIDCSNSNITKESIGSIKSALGNTSVSF